MSTENTTVTKSALSESLTALSDVIAAELLKNIEISIKRKLERTVEDYLEGQDFMYTLEDIVKDKLTEIVDDQVSDITVRVVVDQ